MDRSKSKRQHEAGTVSLEFALVVPLLMVLIFATVTLGHALYVRHKLSDVAATIARSCVLEVGGGQRCYAIANQLVAESNQWCGGGVGVTIQAVPMQGLRHVYGLKVRLDCRFVGGFGREYLRASNITIADFTVSALMPYSVPRSVP
jgi:hypothetical protein